MSKKLFVSDLDGTLIPANNNFSFKPAVEAFNKIIQQNKQVCLAYATGRHHSLAIKGVRKAGLIEPQFYICDVGTSIYEKIEGEWERDLGYRDLIKQNWKSHTRQDIANALRNIQGLKEQEKNKLKEFKQSYYVSLEDDTKKILKRARQKLGDVGIDFNLIYSVDYQKNTGLLDIVPEKASKITAIDYLKNKLKIRNENLVFAGNSGNDEKVFLSDIQSIVVGNASENYQKKLKSKINKNSKGNKVFFTNFYYSHGVLDGLRHFKIIKKTSKKKEGLYIQIHSMHGLFRGKYLELGRDEDTGGQIVYVLELAKALSKNSQVDRVEIITRKIEDKDYPGYSQDIEKVNEKVSIIRIPCGPKKYIKKVKLWPYIDDFVDNTIDYISRQNRKPDILHSNYADSGYVCAKLSDKLNIPQVHTGHSLGKNKMDRLGVKKDNYKKFDKIYNFTKRLAAEQLAVDNSEAIIVSSEYEQKVLYKPYDISTRSKKFHVIPPGIDYEKFYSFKSKKNYNLRKKVEKKLLEHLPDIDKPMILCLSRLDKRKNIISLVKAYAENEILFSNAYLVLALGPLNNLDNKRQALADKIIKIINKNNLQNSIAIIEKLNQVEVAEMYRVSARSGGVFVNPALIEPFGLTLVEASACGLPIIATENGGPVDIIKNCQNGLLINPTSIEDIAESTIEILHNKKLWQKYSNNGISFTRKIYAWPHTVKEEVKIFKDLLR